MIFALFILMWLKMHFVCWYVGIKIQFLNYLKSRTAIVQQFKVFDIQLFSFWILPSSLCIKCKKIDARIRKYSTSLFFLFMILQFYLQIKSSKDAGINITSLPVEILIKIFGFLSQNELGRIARYVYFIWNSCIQVLK